MKKLLLAMAFGCVSLFAAVDINSASKDELKAIKGIGEKKAQLIIDYRATKCFENLEELDKVKGFGAKSVERLSDVLEVQPCDAGEEMSTPAKEEEKPH